jgi:hypothetical protein
MTSSFDHRLAGLEGFWMAGQWLAAGGGIPPAVAQGRDVVALMCAADHVPLGRPGGAPAPVADDPPITSLGELAEGAFGALAMLAALATPMLQPARAHWGLSAEEAAATWLGDDVVPAPTWSWTHAVDIDASAAAVWPWVVQIGQGRAGSLRFRP